MMATQTISIQQRSYRNEKMHVLPCKQVKATIIGPFGVHKNMCAAEWREPWVLGHMATGMKIAGARLRRDVVALANLLQPLGWDFDKASDCPEPTRVQTCKIIRDWKLGYTR